jgi:hypothetical protein
MAIIWRFGIAALMLLSASIGKGQTAAGVVAAGGGNRPTAGGRTSVVPSKGHTRIPTLPARPLNNPAPSINLLGTVPTASAAESFALSGNLAYTCDNNEISVINIANPSNMTVAGTATASLIQNSADIHCSIQRGTLVAFSDQTSSTAGDSPGFVAFSLTNPTQPALIPPTPINKRFFVEPLYLGNIAFVPTFAVTFDTFFGLSWDGQFGDLLAVNVADFTHPQLIGTLEPSIDPSGVLGGANAIFGVTQANGSLLYLGYSTSTGAANNGVGALVTVDATNPVAMKIVGQVLIPGTIQSGAPLIQGTVGVAIGNTGGFQPDQNPLQKGNIVVTTFDVSDPRQPQVLSINPTTYTVGNGGGAVLIGTNLFAFGGTLDANGNNVLLVVDTTNAAAPIVESIPISQPFTDIHVAGTTLFATLGSGGFAAYSIPGTSNAPVLSCPASIDAMVVVDRGGNIPSAAFSSAQTAIDAYINSLHLPADQVGVASFTSSAQVNQTLTNNATVAINSVGQVIPGSGGSFIGAGISAAQGELTSSRHNPSAATFMIIVSDGADLDAPNSAATLAAANAAKAAGTQIIAVQYGTGSSALMQKIASSSATFYQVTQ